MTGPMEREINSIHVFSFHVLVGESVQTSDAGRSERGEDQEQPRLPADDSSAATQCS